MSVKGIPRFFIKLLVKRGDKQMVLYKTIAKDYFITGPGPIALREEYLEKNNEIIQLLIANFYDYVENFLKCTVIDTNTAWTTTPEGFWREDSKINFTIDGKQVKFNYAEKLIPSHIFVFLKDPTK